MDPDYVSKVEDLAREYESRNRLLYIGLEAPPVFQVKEIPRKPLSKEWHRLLESCLELTMQADILSLAANSLSTVVNRAMSYLEIGKRHGYHFRSWFIHATTLRERANDLIKRSARVYLHDRSSISKLIKHYQKRLDQEITDMQGTDIIKKYRNSYVHAERSWSSGVTKYEGWEYDVAIDRTIRQSLDLFHYPYHGKLLMRGKYEHFAKGTTMILDDIGKILQELEQDLMTNYKLKCRMGALG